ncbi:MAG: acetolactate decarboxylase [Vampirovibrionia bacterium]
MNIKHFIIICICCIMFPNFALADKMEDYIYQVSTIKALLNGDCESDVTIETLKEHGDIGIGLLNKLDGSFVAEDGNFYKLNSEDKINIIKDNDKTPFAMMVHFDPDKALYLKKKISLADMKLNIDKELPSTNLFYAFKINGKFSNVSLVMYPEEVEEETKNQKTFNYDNIEGTIVGFKAPEKYKGLSINGYQLMFIDKTKTIGGYLVDCNIQKATVFIDFVYDIYFKLPDEDVLSDYRNDAMVDK